MGELWTYAPAHFVPFSAEVYGRLFVRLNRAVWPLHLVALAVGVGALWSLWRGRNRLAAGLLVPCWLSAGWLFHLEYYAELNWLGYYTGWAFVGQGLVVGASGAAGRFDPYPSGLEGIRGWLGLGTTGFAVVGFPFLALLEARPWAGAEVIGIAADPTVLATLGAALTAERLPGETLFVPLAWCAVTGTTGWVVGSWGALLTASAGLAVLLVVAVQGLSHGT